MCIFPPPAGADIYGASPTWPMIPSIMGPSHFWSLLGLQKGRGEWRICQLWEDTLLLPGVPTSLSWHMEECLYPQGEAPGPRKCKGGSTADWGRDMGLPTHLATDVILWFWRNAVPCPGPLLPCCPCFLHWVYLRLQNHLSAQQARGKQQWLRWTRSLPSGHVYRIVRKQVWISKQGHYRVGWVQWRRKNGQHDREQSWGALHMWCQSVWAAVTKITETGRLIQKFISHSSRGWKSKFKGPTDSKSDESLLSSLQMATSLPSSHT